MKQIGELPKELRHGHSNDNIPGCSGRGRRRDLVFYAGEADIQDVTVLTTPCANAGLGSQLARCRCCAALTRRGLLDACEGMSHAEQAEYSGFCEHLDSKWIATVQGVDLLWARRVDSNGLVSQGIVDG